MCEMKKVCTKCGVEKELDEFYKTHGNNSKCKECYAILRKTKNEGPECISNIKIKTLLTISSSINIGEQNELTHIEFCGIKNSIYYGKWKCNICSYKFYSNYNSIKNNRKCKECFFKKKSKSNEYYINNINSKYNEFLTALSVISNPELQPNKQRIICYCKICKTQATGRISHIQQKGVRALNCNCNRSLGEIIIKKYLIKNNIIFEEEKTFDNLFYMNKLRYDFYLPDFNLIIEFQGEQHKKFVPFFHKTIEQFNIQQKRDEIKFDYANTNGIKVIFIDYSELDQINFIMDSIFKQQ